MRVTAFASTTCRGQLADLELRHRRRARCEDRIRGAKDTGLTNLPLHAMDANRLWCANVALAYSAGFGSQPLAWRLPGQASCWHTCAASMTTADPARVLAARCQLRA